MSEEPLSSPKTAVRRGDRFIQRHPDARWPLFFEVTRVGKTGWVDIRCYTWAVSWAKRMPLGLGPVVDDPKWHTKREDWTHEDILATVPA